MMLGGIIGPMEEEEDVIAAAKFLSKPLCNTQVAIVDGTNYLFAPKEIIDCLKAKYITSVGAVGIDESNIFWIQSYELERRGGSIHCSTNANREFLPEH